MFEERSPLLGVVLTILAVLVGVATVFTCVIAYLALVKPEQALVIISELSSLPTSTPVVVVVTAPAPTSLPTYTPQATYTPFPTHTAYPTPTAQSTPPTATPSPSPMLQLPFEDTFDLRPRPEWQAVIGNWRVVDGHLTTDPGSDWRRTMVGDERWVDYVLDVDVWADDWFYPVRIIVRAGEVGHMAVETNIHGTDWILLSDGDEHVIAHGGEGIDSYGRYEEAYHFTIEVQGDIYTAYLDGTRLLQVQDGTFVAGKVGLAFRTFLHQDPTWFDNFTVAELK